MNSGERTSSSSSSSSYAVPQKTKVVDKEEEEEEELKGGGSGWVEPLKWCPHLSSLPLSDFSHIPTPHSSCFRCDHPAENWLCLFCKDVLCSRFINKHMLEHYQQKGHCLALSYSDLSVWCFACDAYLDAQVIQQLRLAYETAYMLKFGESPPVRTVECMQLEEIGAGSSS